jgi:hypothetical protein
MRLVGRGRGIDPSRWTVSGLTSWFRGDRGACLILCVNGFVTLAPKAKVRRSGRIAKATTVAAVGKEAWIHKDRSPQRMPHANTWQLTLVKFLPSIGVALPYVDGLTRPIWDADAY